MSGIDPLKLDKSAFKISSLYDEPDDKEFWLDKTPYERLEALEQMRQIIYGYSPSSARLQRVFEIAQLKSD